MIMMHPSWAGCCWKCQFCFKFSPNQEGKNMEDHGRPTPLTVLIDHTRINTCFCLLWRQRCWPVVTLGSNFECATESFFCSSPACEHDAETLLLSRSGGREMRHFNFNYVKLPYRWWLYWFLWLVFNEIHGAVRSFVFFFFRNFKQLYRVHNIFAHLRA